jgi:Methylase involved in ubiquinone/menaquinone biosynthesis
MSADYDNRSTDLFEQIRALYNDLALHPEKDFGRGKGKENARHLGYDRCWLEHFSASVWESAAAVGNPFCLGPIHPGETVLDFGCGAGADLCIAALLVGPTGRVIGFDLTPAMVQKARANAERTGLANMTVYEADMAQVPLQDACADVVISNGAINLLPDKACALREAFRVLKLGGRLHIADMIRDESAPRCESIAGESWADCVGGTVSPDCFLQILAEIGFVRAECVKTTHYRTSASTHRSAFFRTEAFKVKIRGYHQQRGAHAVGSREVVHAQTPRRPLKDI